MVIIYHEVTFTLYSDEAIEIVTNAIDEEEFEQSLRNGIESAILAKDFDLFSDLYKELYGIRPRWMPW